MCQSRQMKYNKDFLARIDGEQPEAPVYNFGAGPAMLPGEVMRIARDEFLDWHGCGMSVMEMGHHSDEFMSIFAQLNADLRQILSVPNNYKILLLQGGARSQFAMVPLNLLGNKESADYLNTGIWSAQAIYEAKRFGRVNIATQIEGTVLSIPDPQTWSLDVDAAYVYYTENETVNGVQFPYVPDVGDVPLVADMTSSLLTNCCDISRYGIIFAASQKNFGPPGLVVVIIREDLIGQVPENVPSFYNYAIHDQKKSMFNTPTTYSWYLSGLVLQWVKRQGGIPAMAEMCRLRSTKLYQLIDASDFYINTVDPQCRSKVNVPFNLTDSSLDERFLTAAKEHGLVGLKGHRIVGGMRASMYNAMTIDAVNILIDFMQDFERTNT